MISDKATLPSILIYLTQIALDAHRVYTPHLQGNAKVAI